MYKERVKRGRGGGTETKEKVFVIRCLYFFSAVRLCRVFRCEKGITWHTCVQIRLLFRDFYLPRAFPSFSLSDISDSTPSSRIGFLATVRRDIGYRAPRSVNKRDI